MTLLLRYPWMTDDIEMFRSQVRRFIEAEMVPHLPRWREQGMIEGDVWKRMGALGMMSLNCHRSLVVQVLQMPINWSLLMSLRALKCR